jgi:hypothetical protein
MNQGPIFTDLAALVNSITQAPVYYCTSGAAYRAVSATLTALMVDIYISFNFSAISAAVVSVGRTSCASRTRRWTG